MKRLCLVRHAKSSWKKRGLADFERPLKKRGKRDAAFAGERLGMEEIRPDLIVTSPARRALQTARIIAAEIGFPLDNILSDQTIYEAGVSALLEVIEGVDNAFDHVMLFGHNPGFTMLAEYLLGGQVANMPTCGVLCIDFDVDSWKAVPESDGTLAFTDFPKKHAR